MFDIRYSIAFKLFAGKGYADRSRQNANRHQAGCAGGNRYEYGGELASGTLVYNQVCLFFHSKVTPYRNLSREFHCFLKMLMNFKYFKS